MYPEILHHIERLQIELASVDAQGGSVTVSLAVARIAAELRETAMEMPGDPILEYEPLHYTPVFMQ